jgi:hypothetical protein
MFMKISVILIFLLVAFSKLSFSQVMTAQERRVSDSVAAKETDRFNKRIQERHKYNVGEKFDTVMASIEIVTHTENKRLVLSTIINGWMILDYATGKPVGSLRSNKKTKIPDNLIGMEQEFDWSKKKK